MNFEDFKGKVIFIGAGPGDPELITVKGAEAIKNSDVIIYAGSLVNPAVLDIAKDDAQIYDSANMNLDEILDVIKKAHEENKIIARVHTGDPAIYGAIAEQINQLRDELSQFPPEKAIYDIDNPKLPAPWDGKLSPVVTSCANIFTTADGQDLLYEIVSILCYAKIAKTSIESE